jgi:hypothetical protein
VHLEGDERLAVAGAFLGEDANDVGDRFDHLHDIARLGLVVHREVQLVELIVARTAVADPASNKGTCQRGKGEPADERPAAEPESDDERPVPAAAPRATRATFVRALRT